LHARAIQASGRIQSHGGIESVGKWPLDETGKYPVNEIGEEILAGSVSLRDSSGHDIAVIPGARERELWCAIAYLRISRFRVWR
jgi:hypothetical protein